MMLECRSQVASDRYRLPVRGSDRDRGRGDGGRGHEGHALRHRGVDVMESRVGGAVTTGFPIYDAHGNNVATLSRSGTTYALGDKRTYDAWCLVRSQDSAGDPTLRYCGSLGHKQDEETSFIYMRARYYEPAAGRFVSEDRARAGFNWLTYCVNDPVNMVDETGCESSPAFRQIVRLVALAAGGAMVINAYFAAINATNAVTPDQLMRAYNDSLQAVAVIGLAMVYTTGTLSKNLDIAFVLGVAGAIFSWLGPSVAAAAAAGKSLAKNAISACFGYSLIVAGFLLADIMENME
jgi:RHS repeat-associated protein